MNRDALDVRIHGHSGQEMWMPPPPKLPDLLRWAARLIPDQAQNLEAAASRLEVDGSREAILAAKQAAAAAWRVADSEAMREVRMGGDHLKAAGGRAVAEDAMRAASRALAALG
jgi:hypothetical protein